jgi:hypothetical protein
LFFAGKKAAAQKNKSAAPLHPNRKKMRGYFTNQGSNHIMSSSLLSGFTVFFLLLLWVGQPTAAQAQIAPGNPGLSTPTQPAPGTPDPADTVSVEPVKFKFIPFREWSRPAKAAFYSAVLPGLGQAYNKKFWKIPIVYAGIGVIGYYIVDNNKKYHLFQEAYLIRTDKDPGTLDRYADRYSDQTLRYGVNYYRKNRDLSVILMVGMFALNIVDAHVDAHLREFDISDDLSFKLKPQLLPVAGNHVAPALTLKLNVKP